MNYAYLITGGNIGNARQQLDTAAALLEAHCGPIIDRSAVYETAPWGNPDQENFLNQVLVVETKLNAAEVMKTMVDIERRMGRERREKNGPRVIDIDMLFFNHQIINEPDLTVPHPRLRERRFVLEPLNEVAPAYIHPVFYKTVRQLLDECTDPLAAKKLDA